MGRNASRRRNKGLNKAVNPGIMQAFEAAPKTLEPRRFGLMDAINLATGQGINGFRPLPRDPRDEGVFGPLNPLDPEPIDPLLPSGRPEPRVWEYPQSWNLPGNNRREVPWQVLREAAMGVDIIRRCIEVRKRHVRSLQWSWAPRAQVIEDAYLQDPKQGFEDAAAELRAQFAPDIARLTEFWTKPWKANNWSFGKWVNALMEEYLVLDAIAVYPRTSFGGDVLDLEMVDGATIKPLLDVRGARPLPPHPAFQQELYGFPRGEWAASVTHDDQGRLVVDNAYAASELFYYAENVRTHSPYGLSAVEQALISARLYLRRQEWMLVEYDDGSTPLTVFEPPADPAMSDFTPAQRRTWEDSINAELRGQARARHRIKVAPPGWRAHQLSTVDERYKPEYDLHLIKLLAGHFNVNATELGFNEQKGLGSAGWQEGQAEAQGRVGLRPDTEVLADIVNEISRQFLNCPPELHFSFIDPASENDKESDDVRNQQRGRATLTLNDDRRALKLPLLDIPEADMPHFVTPTGPIFLDGAFERAQQAAEAQQMQAQATVTGTEGKLEIEQAKLDDGKQAREENREFARETREVEQKADVTKAATPGQAHTGAMVALIPTPADAARLAVDGGIPADQLHLTLAFLGKAADIAADAQRRITSAIEGTMEDAIRPDYDLPVHADGFSISAFNPGGEDPCIVLGVGGEDLAYIRGIVLDTLGEAQATGAGFTLPKQHSPWVPHVTLVYTDDVEQVADLADRTGPIVFDRIRVSFGGRSVDVPLRDVRQRAEVAKSAELHAFRNWRRKNPNPRRPFTFKKGTPEDLDSPVPGPTVATFGDEWEWLEDLEKYESWWPRDARGRWVKRSHLAGNTSLIEALNDVAKPALAKLSDGHIRSLSDDQLMDLFADISKGDALDEDLARRLIADMDRREQADRDNPWLTAKTESWDWETPAAAHVLDVRDDDVRREAAAAAVDRLPGESVTKAVRRGYDEHVHLAYLAAEKATKGNLINRAGQKANIDPLHLFSGPLSRARRYASEELMRWWATHGRLNFTQYRAQVLHHDRDIAAARVTAGLSSGRDFL